MASQNYRKAPRNKTNNTRQGTPYSRPRERHSHQESLGGVSDALFGKIAAFKEWTASWFTWHPPPPRDDEESDSSDDEPNRLHNGQNPLNTSPFNTGQGTTQLDIRNLIQRTSNISKEEYEELSRILKSKVEGKDKLEETKPKESSTLRLTPAPSNSAPVVVPPTQIPLKPVAVHSPNATPIDIVGGFLTHKSKPQTTFISPKPPTQPSYATERPSPFAPAFTPSFAPPFKQNGLKRSRVSPPRHDTTTLTNESKYNQTQQEQENEEPVYLAQPPPTKRRGMDLNGTPIAASETAKRVLQALEQISSPFSENRMQRLPTLKDQVRLTSERGSLPSSQLKPIRKVEKPISSRPIKSTPLPQSLDNSILEDAPPTESLSLPQRRVPEKKQQAHSKLNQTHGPSATSQRKKEPFYKRPQVTEEIEEQEQLPPPPSSSSSQTKQSKRYENIASLPNDFHWTVQQENNLQKKVSEESSSASSEEEETTLNKQKQKKHKERKEEGGGHHGIFKHPKVEEKLKMEEKTLFGSSQRITNSSLFDRSVAESYVASSFTFPNADIKDKLKSNSSSMERPEREEIEEGSDRKKKRSSSDFEAKKEVEVEVEKEEEKKSVFPSFTIPKPVDITPVQNKEEIKSFFSFTKEPEKLSEDNKSMEKHEKVFFKEEIKVEETPKKEEEEKPKLFGFDNKPPALSQGFLFTASPPKVEGTTTPVVGFSSIFPTLGKVEEKASFSFTKKIEEASKPTSTEQTIVEESKTKEEVSKKETEKKESSPFSFLPIEKKESSSEPKSIFGSSTAFVPTSTFGSSSSFSPNFTFGTTTPSLDSTSTPLTGSTVTPSIFGATPSTGSTTTPSIFGSTSTTGSSTTPSIFGSTSTSGSTTTPSIFGSTSTPSTTGSSTTPSIFGASTSVSPTPGSTPASTTSLFGTSTSVPSTTTPSTTPSIFTTPSSSSSSSSSLFGSSTPASSSSSLFGSSTNPPSSLFGASTTSNTTSFGFNSATDMDKTETHMEESNSFGQTVSAPLSSGFNFGTPSGTPSVFGNVSTSTNSFPNNSSMLGSSGSFGSGHISSMDSSANVFGGTSFGQQSTPFGSQPFGSQSSSSGFNFGAPGSSTSFGTAPAQTGFTFGDPTLPSSTPSFSSMNSDAGFVFGGSLPAVTPTIAPPATPFGGFGQSTFGTSTAFGSSSVPFGTSTAAPSFGAFGSTPASNFGVVPFAAPFPNTFDPQGQAGTFNIGASEPRKNVKGKRRTKKN